VHADLPAQDAARARLRLPPGATIFLFFGMLRRDKGIEYLIEATTHLPSGQAAVVVAGAPMEYSADEVRALIHAAGVADRLQPRLGYVPDTEVAWYFAACDALVLPYTPAYTGGSGPLMKGACSYGLPVIATDVAEMGRLVREHGLGLVARPGDAGSLADELVRFLTLDRAAREGMRANARALAQANSWEALAERYGRLFQAMVSSDSLAVSRPAPIEREMRR
jgi:glycosyltransferase involved in cell wall biosynthesis